MGRHSSPQQGHFYRSFFGWVGLWAMIAMVTGIAVWFVVGAIGGPNTRTSVAADAPAADEQDEPVEPAPTVSGAVITNEPPSPSPSPEPPQEDAAKDTKLITEGVSVQVLNGTADAGASQALADKLAGLGFTIIAVEESSRMYPETTVFWSTDASRDAAVALATRFGWVSEPKPANLSDGVSVHVVVGADELS